MAKGIEVVKEVRNDVCGHVRETVVQETLDEIADSEVFGFLEIGPTMRRTYFKFAGELVIQILVRGVPQTDKHRVFMEKNKKIADLFNAFTLIERSLDIYIEGRNLLLRQQR